MDSWIMSDIPVELSLDEHGEWCREWAEKNQRRSGDLVLHPRAEIWIPGLSLPEVRDLVDGTAPIADAILRCILKDGNIQRIIIDSNDPSAITLQWRAGPVDTTDYGWPQDNQPWFVGPGSWSIDGHAWHPIDAMEMIWPELREICHPHEMRWIAVGVNPHHFALHRALWDMIDADEADPDVYAAELASIWRRANGVVNHQFDVDELQDRLGGRLVEQIHLHYANPSDLQASSITLRAIDGSTVDCPVVYGPMREHQCTVNGWRNCWTWRLPDGTTTEHPPDLLTSH